MTPFSHVAIREKWNELASAREAPFRVPQSFDAITIVSLGMVTSQTVVTRHAVYPAGFRSLHALSPSTVLACSIEQGRFQEPVFVVEGDGFAFRGSTPTEVWSQALAKLVIADPEANGLEAFGLTIPEVAIALSKLPGIEQCANYEGPEVEEEELTETEDLQAVLQSQWHPACHGYSMTEREDAETPPDPSVTSPIFFGFSEETTLVCEVCGLPATTTHPLESFSTCDVQRSLEELREGKEPELAPKETTAHASCRRAMLQQLQETIKTWKRALEKWSLLPADK